MTALSPREEPPPLRSSNAKPRRTRSKYEVTSIARGFTMRAGQETRERLHRGVSLKRTPRPRKEEEDHGEVSSTQEESPNHADDA